KYPIEVIRSMVRTIASVEKNPNIYFRFREVNPDAQTFLSDSLVLAACKLAKDVGAKAIVGMTASGYTAFKSSSHRPDADIFVFTGNKSLINKVSLVWGTRAYHYDKSDTTDSTISDVEQILKKEGHVQTGDVFIFLASMPIHERARTNSLKIHVVK